ncbi:response regulator transcription factor [Pseudohoeflea suaedae]|nr:response regulator [Pseudohoeflea suaedae]
MERRILVVVDEAVMAAWLPGHLEAAGWNVTHAGDEAAALACLDATTETPPDAAIVDAVLGEGDGFALIQDIRKQLPGILIVCASARAGNVARLKALAAGADAYIAKPFRLADLDDLINARCEAS